MWQGASHSLLRTRCLQQVSAHFWLLTVFQVTVILEGTGPQRSLKWILALGCILVVWAQEGNYTAENCHLGQLENQSK